MTAGNPCLIRKSRPADRSGDASPPAAATVSWSAARILERRLPRLEHLRWMYRLAWAVPGSQVTDKNPAVRLDAWIGLAVAGQPIGLWSPRTGAPEASGPDGTGRRCRAAFAACPQCRGDRGRPRPPVEVEPSADNHGQHHGGLQLRRSLLPQVELSPHSGQQDKQLDGAASEPGQGWAKASPYRAMVERTGSSEGTYDLAHPTPHTDRPWPESDGAASRDRQRLGSPARY